MASQPPLTVTASTTSAINRQFLTVSPDTSVAEVINRMSSKADGQRASCALVVDASEAIVGIMTERDIVGFTAAQTGRPQSLAGMPVSDIMTTPVKTLAIDAFQDIFAVLFLFRRYRIRHLPIVDEHKQIIGIVTPTSIRKVLKPANLLKIRRVADIMTEDVVQASADESVVFLAQLMAEHRVSCVVIVDTPTMEENGEPATNPPIGIVTERDIVQFQASGLNLHQQTAREVMSSPLFLLDPQDSLWAAHEAMNTRKVRRLVVSWNWGKCIGIITQTSLLRVFDPIEMCSIIDSLQQTIKQLTVEANQTTSGQATALMPNSCDSNLDTAPEPSVSALMSQAAECIAIAAKHPQLTAFQHPQLEQILQLIQQVKDTLPDDTERSTEPHLKLV